MKRRDFLKGMVVASAAALCPALTPFSPPRKPWEFVGSDRNVRNCTDDFLFERPDPCSYDKLWATISMPWGAEATPDEVLEIVEEMFP